MAGGTGHARSRVIFFLSLTPFPQSFVHASCAFLSLVSFPRTPRPHWSCVSHSFTRKTFRRERMAVGHACAFPSVFLLLVDRWGDRGGRQRERERDRKASPACASRMCVYADSREARRNGMRARASCSLPVTKHARRATGSRGYSAVDVTLRFLLLLLLLLQTRWERGVVFGLTDVCCYGHGCALLRCDSVSGHQARDRGW